MPYELHFTWPITITDRDQYINECCVGGDVIVDELLPVIRDRYGEVLDTGQEDWGWFIWFRKGDVGLAVDVFTEDAERGEFNVHLTSRTKRFLFRNKIVDTPELEELRTLVVSELAARVAGKVAVERIAP